MPEYSSISEGPHFQQLLSQGFTECEATRLVHMKEHVGEQKEYREMVEESRRLAFMRWLVEHDRISW
ncbi:hypothetical protein [Tengunoibacter tsumagoiensis]|uniref:Uncharacterized protein n=1 Tax=Tengunoibacter tsumagoiensis TaxID=2014871 RepID=A0A402A1Y7_9CHLR|nr:hypothetical protein [Tengunoibacter tsumagoiensis]GCE13076.1 hypothetical protein KTT_29350 [Tengunoibacter tsumagoiensis]